MRRVVGLVVALLLVWLLAVPAQAANDIHVVLDGAELKLDVAPFVEQDRTLVPVRALSEGLGFKVDWNEAEQKITLTRASDTIEFWVDSTRVLINGKEAKLDVPARKVNGRTFIPLRFVAENLGASVKWAAGTQTATVTSAKGLATEAVAKQQAEPNLKGTGTFKITMVMSGAGLPVGKLTVETSMQMTMQTYKGEMLMTMSTELVPGQKQLTQMAVRNGKMYQMLPSSTQWLTVGNYDPNNPMNTDALANLFGTDPLNLQKDVMDKVSATIAGTEEIDGVKYTRVTMDLSGADFSGMVDKLITGLGGAAAGDVKVQVEKYTISYLVNPETLAMANMDLELAMTMTMKTPGGDMTIHEVMSGRMKMAPLSEPIQFPADLPQ